MSRRDYDPDQDWDFFPDHFAPTIPKSKLKKIQLKIAERLIGNILPATLGELEELADYPNFAYAAIKKFYDGGYVSLKVENEEALLVFAKPTLATWWSMTLKPSRREGRPSQQPPPSLPPTKEKRKASSQRKSPDEVKLKVAQAFKHKCENPNATRKQTALAVGPHIPLIPER